MTHTAGIDVGSSAVKTVIVRHAPGGAAGTVVAKRRDRLRHRDVISVSRESYEEALAEAGLARGAVAYVATTGEGELVDFRTGHFYGMTAHARGGVHLVPQARVVLDVGALHARAIVTDEAGRVVRYRMTSQCASGSGQFIENIGRYLGVALEEIGTLSMGAGQPEKCSSICAVLAETDVINMVSRGISTPNILRGIHLSMAGRFVKLLEAAGPPASAGLGSGPPASAGLGLAPSIVAVTGGLAADRGLIDAMRQEAARTGAGLEFVSHEDAVYAGALGAALWGRYRVEKLAASGAVP